MSRLEICFGTAMCRRNERFRLIAANEAWLCHDRLLANRGRMPGFANQKMTYR
jgi:hypothetical protein